MIKILTPTTQSQVSYAQKRCRDGRLLKHEWLHSTTNQTNLMTWIDDFVTRDDSETEPASVQTVTTYRK